MRRERQVKIIALFDFFAIIIARDPPRPGKNDPNGGTVRQGQAIAFKRISVQGKVRRIVIRYQVFFFYAADSISTLGVSALFLITLSPTKSKLKADMATRLSNPIYLS